MEATVLDTVLGNLSNQRKTYISPRKDSENIKIVVVVVLKPI